MNLHFHALALDGVYVRDGAGVLQYHALPTPSSEQVTDVARWASEGLIRMCCPHCRDVMKLVEIAKEHEAIVRVLATAGLGPKPLGVDRQLDSSWAGPWPKPAGRLQYRLFGRKKHGNVRMGAATTACMRTPSMRIVPLSVLAFIGTTALASDALAATCDALYLDGEAQDVIIGEAGYEACVGGTSPFCYFQPYLIGGPKLGVCWRDAGGSWQMEVLDCTDDNTSSDLFYLSTAGGDDRVAILREEFTIGDLTLLSAGANTGAMYCGSNGDALAGFHPDFDFQIYAYLGEGTDLYQGSDNRDVAWTNGPVYSGGTWTSPADNGFDKVCTYAGNDTIYGDGDDQWTVAEDWMDAGAGSDYCDGDYGVDGSDNDDLWLGCETHYDALSDASLGWIDCTEDDDPLHEW